jgi:hypothetical protein
MIQYSLVIEMRAKNFHKKLANLFILGERIFDCFEKTNDHRFTTLSNIINNNVKLKENKCRLFVMYMCNQVKIVDIQTLLLAQKHMLTKKTP